MIEDIIENPPHDASEDLECAHGYVSDDDNTYTLDLSHEETITKSYKENYDEVCMAYDETPPSDLLLGIRCQFLLMSLLILNFVNHWIFWKLYRIMELKHSLSMVTGLILLPT